MDNKCSLDDSIDGVHHPVAGDNVEPGDEGLSAAARHLDELGPSGGNLLPAGGSQRGHAGRNVLTLKTAGN